MTALVFDVVDQTRTYHSIVDSKVGNTLNEEDIRHFLTSVHNLLTKYKIYSRSSHSPASSGGLQQLITQKMKKLPNRRQRMLYSKDESVTFGNESHEIGENSYIQCLPDNLKLYIFSFLDAKSLCMASCVNRDWNELACDDLLWKDLLKLDIPTWSQISHLTNPQVYLDVGSEWSKKDIYLRCCPAFREQFRQSTSTFHQVSLMLKYLLPKKTPKVAMFGPGLEQSTSGLVRQMLYEDNQIFTRVAMFPGQFDGVGGGMTLKLSSGHSLHLSVLYTASRQERENRVAQDRVQWNKMLQVRQADHDAEPHYELKTQIKYLCQTLDAFIFVVDASETPHAIASARSELMAMIKERRSVPHIPLLVLSCVKNKEITRLPACEIVEILQLSTISQPWLVIDCESDSLSFVDTGIVWLVDQAQYK